jgi:excinuclease UvrABC ATPase subunit
VKDDSRVRRQFPTIRFLQESSYETRDFLIVALGLSKAIADVFASTIEARSLGLKSGDFDVSNGSKLCRDCRKSSDLKEASECDVCKGAFLSGLAGAVTYKDHRMVDVLRLSIDGAVELFGGFREIRKGLELAQIFGFNARLFGERITDLPLGSREALPLIKFISELPQSHALVLLANPLRSLTGGSSVGSVDLEKKSAQLLKELAKAGHTIVVTDNSGCLYEVAKNVIGLSGSRAENGSLQIRIKK